MAEHIDIHFVAKIIIADLFEKVGMIIIQFQFVNFRILPKQSAIKRRNFDMIIALVNRKE